GSALDTKAGDNAAAIAALQRTIAENADFVPAYINLGGLLERAGAPERALELWQSVLNKPQPVDSNLVSYATIILKQMTRVLSDNSQPEAAESNVGLSLDLAPQHRDSIEQYVALRLSQCKWPTVVPREHVDRKTLMRGIHPLSISIYTD